MFSKKEQINWTYIKRRNKAKQIPEQSEPVHWWGGPHGGSGRAGPSPEQLGQDSLHHLDDKYKRKKVFNCLHIYCQVCLTQVIDEIKKTRADIFELQLFTGWILQLK